MENRFENVNLATLGSISHPYVVGNNYSFEEWVIL